VVTVYSFAKTYALAGLRLGYCVAAPPLATAIRNLQEAQCAGASTLAMAAGYAALDMDGSVVESMKSFYLQHREVVKAMLPADLISSPPDGGYFFLLDLSNVNVPDGAIFARLLLDQHKVRVAPGPAFGIMAAKTVRLTFAVRERDLAEGLEHINALLTELQN
jgi:aspartate/methionine/tyrosine aminotransferase